jgi:hypothetical protein
MEKRHGTEYGRIGGDPSKIALVIYAPINTDVRLQSQEKQSKKGKHRAGGCIWGQKQSAEHLRCSALLVFTSCCGHLGAIV